MRQSYAILETQPWVFRLLNGCMGRDLRGAWRLFQAVRPFLVGKAAPFGLPQGGSMLLPLTWPGVVNGRGLTGYEPDAIAAFAEAISAMGDDVTLIDCGADVGAFTRLVLGRVSNVRNVVAFEPNPDPFDLLRRNLSNLSGIAAQARRSAVSASPGVARLAIDPSVDHDHGAHLDSHGDGLEVAVETIDGLNLPAGPVAIKIDVEGEELRVIEGARATLARAPAFAIQLEAHPDVARRSGIDPQACLLTLRDLGATRFSAYCEQSGERVHDLDPARPFFGQVHPDDIYDVVVVKPGSASTLS